MDLAKYGQWLRERLYGLHWKVQKTSSRHFFINKAEELKASGDTEGLNALISKGVSLETGNWVCFNKETYTLIQKISDLGAPVTISFAYKGLDTAQ